MGFRREDEFAMNHRPALATKLFTVFGPAIVARPDKGRGEPRSDQADGPEDRATRGVVGQLGRDKPGDMGKFRGRRRRQDSAG
jgi:hypothetical protein